MAPFDLKEEILRLKEERNAIILAHSYQTGDIQDMADYVGDSLGLAYKAQNTDCDVIAFCGVHFMAETAKILNPDKTVILPDADAGCSLEASCDAGELEAFLKENAHKNYYVVAYVNCSIGVKALSQWQADEALPSGETILAWMNEANRNILATRANANQMKTTAVALYLYKNQAVWAHIGDSRLYHFHNGVLADYTEDHSLAQLSIKMGELHSRSEIPSFEGRSKLFRVIGDDEIKPQLHAPITLSPGDHAFLLCSDGLWERLLEDEIMLDLHKAATAEEWVYLLRCRAMMRKSTDVDNNTAIAIWIKE